MSPSTADHAHHRAVTPRPVQLARVSLAVGAVLAGAAVFGPVWVVRAGVLLAVVAGVVALVYASRALREQRRSAGEQSLAAARAHGAALRAERTHHAEVLDVLTSRITATRESLASVTAEVGQQRAKISGLRAELQILHGENTDLRHELDDAHTQLSRAQETMGQQEAELFVLRAEAESADAEQSTDAEVWGIPRRGRAAELGPAASAS